MAQSITVGGSGTVTGRTASLSVLGRDDAGESRLVYSWSVTSAPSGGSAGFNLNGTNAAKNATATFTKVGTYTLAVRIVDAGGRSVSSTKSIVVKPTLTSISLSTASGQAISPGSALAVSGVSQAFAARGFDQFGVALASRPGFSWVITAVPSGAPQPVLSGSGGNATLKFGKAGAYGLSVRASAVGGAVLSTNASIVVGQVLSSLKNTSIATVYVNGTSLQPAIPTFADQFGNPMSVAPVLSWSTYSSPQGAPAPTFTTSGGVTTVGFGMAGNYMLTARGVNYPTATFVVVVTVRQTLTSITVSPNTSTVTQGTDRQFSAQAFDQFHRSMATLPTYTWTASGGTIKASGLYTASGNVGACTVTARSGSVSGTAAVTVVASSGTGTFKNAALGRLITSLDADGSISRQDMIQILRSVGGDGVVDAVEFTDLKSLLNQATTLNIADYVKILANDVINGNAANAKYQGQTLGNLAAGSSATLLNKLVDKWFLGADHPAPCNTSLVYKSVAGSLFPRTPSHLDEVQGQLGDCYFISALGTIADSNPAAVQNMFIDNGDGTWTVRFYTNTYGSIYNYSDGSISAGFAQGVGTADYITVDRYLPTTTSGMLVYADYGASYTNTANSLWIPLAEKAYAQWSETGKSGREAYGPTGGYACIQGGWMATVDAQVLGYNAIDYMMSYASTKQVLINALAAHKAVTVGTGRWSGTYNGLYATHAYAIIGYSASTDKFTLYNPWGSNQPGLLSWSQLQASCTQAAVADTSRSVAIRGAAVTSGTVKATFLERTSELAASVASYQLAAASVSQPETTFAVELSDPNAATNASHARFHVTGNDDPSVSPDAGDENAMRDALIAPLVDATFAAEGVLV